MKGIMLADGGSNVPPACAEELNKHNVEILALVVGPDTPKKDAENIVNKIKGTVPMIITSRPDKDRYIMDMIESKEIDILFSCLYDHKIRKELINGAKYGGVNVHPGYLPYNGGQHTSFWGIYNRTPLGSTIHWIDEGLDTGDIIGRIFIKDDGVISAGEVKKKQLDACVKLFREYLPLILDGRSPRIPQPSGRSFHFKKDIISATTVKEDISLDELIRLARGTNCEGHGFYVEVNNRKYKISASVSEVKKCKIS